MEIQLLLILCALFHNTYSEFVGRQCNSKPIGFEFHRCSITYDVLDHCYIDTSLTIYKCADFEVSYKQFLRYSILANFVVSLKQFLRYSILADTEVLLKLFLAAGRSRRRQLWKLPTFFFMFMLIVGHLEFFDPYSTIRILYNLSKCSAFLGITWHCMA